jgi:hypothetical protein
MLSLSLYLTVTTVILLLFTKIIINIDSALHFFVSALKLFQIYMDLVGMIEQEHNYQLSCRIGVCILLRCANVEFLVSVFCLCVCVLCM